MGSGIALRKGAIVARATCALALALACPALARGEESPAQAVTLGATAFVDAMAVAGGDTRGSRAIAKLDVNAVIDGAALGAPGFSALLDVAAYTGNGLSGGVLGDLQGVTSIDGDAALRLLNAWVGWSGRHLAIKAGVIDTNADFDEQNVAAVFLNAAHGMGPELSQSGLNGPGVNPASGLGAVASVFDRDHGLKLRVGLFAGRSGDPARPRRLSWGFGGADGTFTIAEADWSGSRMRVSVGGWRYSSLQPRIDGTGMARGSHGGFALIEGRVAGPADGPHFEGWIRYGQADRTLAPVTHYLGAGLVARGLAGLPGSSALGLAIARARPNPAAGPGSRSETVLESTLQLRVDPHLVVQPDLQVVFAPGGRAERPAAVVPGMRFIVVR